MARRPKDSMATVFVETFLTLISTKRGYVGNADPSKPWPETNPGRWGYINRPDGPDTAEGAYCLAHRDEVAGRLYILPNATLPDVADLAESVGEFLSRHPNVVGAELFRAGWLVETDPGLYTKKASVGGLVLDYWVFDLNRVFPPAEDGEE